MATIRALRVCERRFYVTRRSVADDERHDENDGVDVRLAVMSYGIGRTCNILRHVYLSYRGIEIHPGMHDAEEHQLVFTTRDYYGRGRVEGQILYCETCANRLLRVMSEKSRRFHVFYNNCDTIVLNAIFQTTLLWIAFAGLVVASLVLLLRPGSVNFFTVALMAPVLSIIVTLGYNALDRESNVDRIIARCEHCARYENVFVSS